MTHKAVEGVLLVAHGTVTNLDEMEDFLTAIRRGRPPGAELVKEMRHRYEAIGGSPLLEVTERQALALSKRLDRPVLTGMRFGRPSIEEALLEADRLGLRDLVVLPMAPYSVNLYFGEVRARRWAMATGAEHETLRLLSVAPWGSHPGLIRAHAAWIGTFAGEALRRGASLVLSAHSLPLRVIEIGDQYAREVSESAGAIGAALGQPITLAFQSQGADGGRWLGPDLKEVVSQLVLSGTKEIVVVPFGFLCDHVETLFDLDIELRAETDALGIALQRVPALGLHPMLIETLADLAMQNHVDPSAPSSPQAVREGVAC